MPLRRTFATLAFLAVGMAGAALAQPLPDRPGGDDDLRLAAARLLSERAGEVHDTVVNGLRLSGLMRAIGRDGVDAGRARAYLSSRGLAFERVEDSVRRLMLADADGDGRVTTQEFEAHQGARIGAAAAAVRGMIAIGR
jgi:hypothetical protein